MNTHASSLDQGLSWRAAFAMCIISLLLFGFAYCLLSVGINSALFGHHATGSIVVRAGKPVASELVAQPFNDLRYFQPRPSAAKYDPMNAAGSNQARTNPDLIKRISETRAQVAQRDGVAPAQVADDLLAQSGSGVDPDISVAAAEQQVARVAKARGMDAARVRQALEVNTIPPQFGVLGAPRVNVVQLNLALDVLK